MTPTEIRIALLRKNTSMAEIARQLNPPVHRSAVLRVIDRDFVSIRIMEAVADAIGYPVQYVFPDYFLKNK